MQKTSAIIYGNLVTAFTKRLAYRNFKPSSVAYVAMYVMKESRCSICQFTCNLDLLAMTMKVH